MILTPDTTTTATLIIVNTGRGALRIHAQGCGDVTHDKTQAFLAGGTHWTIETGSTIGQIALYLFGDIPADDYDRDTDEWAEAAFEMFTNEANVLPCCTEHLN